MATITSSLGVGTGIDINGTVTQLTASEGKPQLDAIAAKSAVSQTKLSGLGTLKSALSTFQNSVKVLDKNTAFESRTVSSSDEKILKVSSLPGAVAASHTVKVDALATAKRAVSTVEFGSGDIVAEGVVRFIGAEGAEKFSVKVERGISDSLTAFRDAINNAKGNNSVVASIVNANAKNVAGGTVSKLVLTSKTPGTANAFFVDASAGDTRFNLNQFESVAYVVTEPKDATLTIDSATLPAVSQRSISAAEFSETDKVKAGMIAFRDASGAEKFSVDIVQGINDELFATIDAINNAADNDLLTASVVNGASASNPDVTISKLVFTAKKSGLEGAFSVDASKGDERLTLDDSPINAQQSMTAVEFGTDDRVLPGKLAFKDVNGLSKFTVDMVADTTETVNTGEVDAFGEPILETRAIAGTGNNTLEGLRDAINFNPDNKLIKANIVSRTIPATTQETGEFNDAGEAVVETIPEKTLSKLVLTALTSGTGGHFTVDASEGDSRFALSINTPENFSTITTTTSYNTIKAANASEGGQVITRGSNIISDAINGVSLNLQAVGTANVDVKVDQEGILKPINDFVSSYNKLNTTLKDLTRYVSPGSVENGPLLGNSTVQGISSTLRQAVNDKVLTATGKYDSLGALGVKFDKNGVMSIDSAKLETALADDFTSVANLFVSDDGVATRLNKRVQSYLDPKGPLSTQQSTLNKQLTQLANEKTAVEKRLEETKKNLQKQFIAMDAAVSKLQATGSFLSQQLNNQANNSNR